MLPENRGPDLVGWVLRFGVALFFVAFGVEKFGSDPHNPWIGIFAKIGFGQWFRTATGVIECAGAALLIFPLTTRIAAVILGATMLGAIIAHFTVLGDPGSSVVPLALLLALVVVALRTRQPLFPGSRHTG